MKVVELYTDGGGNNTTNRVGGIGVVMMYGDHLKILCDGFEDTTNNRMEMTSVLHAMKAVNMKNKPVKIYADSAYVVNCFIDDWRSIWENNGWTNSKGKDVENQDLWLELFHEYDQFKDIEFCKVKGHAGDKYNELADLLATIAMARISNGLTNEDVIDIIENIKEKKQKREIVGKYKLSDKQWNDFRKKGEEWLDILKTHLY